MVLRLPKSTTKTKRENFLIHLGANPVGTTRIIHVNSTYPRYVVFTWILGWECYSNLRVFFTWNLRSTFFVKFTCHKLRGIHVLKQLSYRGHMFIIKLDLRSKNCRDRHSIILWIFFYIHTVGTSNLIKLWHDGEIQAQNINSRSSRSILK